jgi:TonB family protein
MRCLRLALLLLFTIAAIQAQTPDTVIAGPYGVPRLVKDDGGQWSTPIQVFSNADEIVYIPDITQPGWAQWHIQAFKEQHMYFVNVYTYFRKERMTIQELIYVNMQTQKVRIDRFLRPSLQLDLRTSPTAMSKAIASITKIAQDSIAHFNGPDIQTVARQQRYALGRMLLCNDPQLPPSPDCSLSDEDFQKKHPIYLNTPQRISPLTTTETLSPPVLVYSAEAQYPAEARATKLSGTVTVGMTVDTQGVPQNLQILKSPGAALNRAALNAVSQYRFKPAHDATGTSVATPVNVDVNFQIY